MCKLTLIIHFSRNYAKNKRTSKSLIIQKGFVGYMSILDNGYSIHFLLYKHQCNRYVSRSIQNSEHCVRYTQPDLEMNYLNIVIIQVQVKLRWVKLVFANLFPVTLPLLNFDFTKQSDQFAGLFVSINKLFYYSTLNIDEN